MAISHQPSEQDQTALFHVLDLDWRSPESGVVWHNFKKLKKTI